MVSVLHRRQEKYVNRFLSYTDLHALMHVVRFVQKITKTGPLSSQVSGSVTPSPNIETDEQLATFAYPTLICSTFS